MTVLPFTGSPAVAPPSPPEIGDAMFEQSRLIYAEVEFLLGLATALERGVSKLRGSILDLAQTRKDEVRHG